MASELGGLLGGLGEGLQAGVRSYMDMSRMQQENALRKKQMQMQAASQGLQENPDTGDYEPSPLTEQQRKLGLLKSADEMSEYDKGSPNAEITRGLLKSQYKLSHPTMKDEDLDKMFPSGMASKDYGRLLGQIKPETAIYGQIESRKPMAEAMKERNQIARGNADLARGKEGAAIADKIKNDKIISGTDQGLAGAAKGIALLDDPKIELSPTLFADANNDFAQAVSGMRGSTEGQRHSQELNFADKKLSEIKTYMTNHPDDLKKRSPEMVSYLRDSFAELQKTLSKIRSDRAGILSEQYGTALKGIRPVEDVLKTIQSQGASAGGLVNKVKVTNGKQTMLIDAADLEEAKKDGFDQVR